MKKPAKPGKPKKPHKPGPKTAGGPVVVPVPGGHHHHKAPKPGRQHHHPHHPHHHPKAAPKVKHAAHHKRRHLALGEGWACCTAEALAASLRLAGWPVGDGDVLALHAAAGGSVDVGVSILEALQAAARVGLAGVRPRGFSEARPDRDLLDALTWGDGNPFTHYRRSAARPVGLLLGAELPGPHAVTVAPDGCWVSWGEHYDPACWPGAATEEAWLIEWEV